MKLLVGFNDINTTHPVVAAEWHPTKNGELTPQQITASSNKKVWWLGACNHEWDAVVYSRTNVNSGTSCPVCSNQRILAGYNDLATINPVVASEWHPTKNGEKTAQQVAATSHKRYWWLGVACGHEWEAPPSDRSRSYGCPVCSNHRVFAGFNDLATVNPALAAEWHPTKNGELTARQITAQSGKKVWWLGECGHEWDTQPVNRARGNGCPICSGRRVLEGFNDLATVNPALAAEWHPTKNGELTARDVGAGKAKTKVWWLGKCGHEWDMTVSHRTSRKDGCPICSNHRILSGFNDLASKNPALAAEWHPTKNGELTPQHIGVSAPVKVWWLGKCGHEWQDTPNHRFGRGSGCPYCSSRRILVGFNDLSSRNPVLAAEWHPTKNGGLTAQGITIGSNKKIWWLGACCHEWEATVASRSSGRNCRQCYTTVSKAEKEIKKFLNKLGLEVETSNRTILNGKELDLWIPDKNIAIEFNGMYWHTEAKGKNEKYHYNKWKACKDAGIQLIQIWEDDWNLRSGAILRSLAHKLGMSQSAKMAARNMEIAIITNSMAEEFLNNNHIYGYKEGSYYLGLKNKGVNGTLQGVMVLDLKTESSSKILEIVRYATYSHIVGGFTKILAYARQAYNPDAFTVVVDHCDSEGNLFITNNFIKEKTLAPDYKYFFRGERKNKNDVRDLSLPDFNRIWDAGKTCYKQNRSGIDR